LKFDFNTLKAGLNRAVHLKLICLHVSFQVRSSSTDCARELQALKRLGKSLSLQWQKVFWVSDFLWVT